MPQAKRDDSALAESAAAGARFVESELDPDFAGAPDAFGAMAIEDRPTGDFIDGFLAGMATVNGALDPNPDARYFFSFDWIGDGEEERAQSLYAAFQAEPTGMIFEVTSIRDWREEVEALGERWLGRRLAAGAAPTLVDELIEVLEAFFGGDRIEVFRVEPSPPAGAKATVPPLGSACDHLLFETPDGRLLLEFSVDE